MSENKLRQLEVPFTCYGRVIIECTQEEYEQSDISPLYERAEKAFSEQIQSFNDLDFDDFDFTCSEFLDE